MRSAADEGDRLVDDVLAAPHDPAALEAVLTPEAVDALVDAAGEPYDDDVTPRLADALGRVVWLFDEQARRLLADRVERSDDAMPQSALNVAIAALQTLPLDAIATLAERVFTTHGERTGERLSLAESLFPFTEPLPPIVETLRDALVRRAEDRGSVEP